MAKEESIINMSKKSHKHLKAGLFYIKHPLPLKTWAPPIDEKDTDGEAGGFETNFWPYGRQKLDLITKKKQQNESVSDSPTVGVSNVTRATKKAHNEEYSLMAVDFAWHKNDNDNSDSDDNNKVG
jgi:hypothetical protein